MVVNVAENIKPISYIKSNASVLVDIETYQKTQDAFEISEDLCIKEF